MIWPFTRTKPSEPIAHGKPDRDFYPFATDKPAFPQVFNEYGVRFLSPEELEWDHQQSLTVLRWRFGGEMPPLFDRDDLHARVVQTLTRHAGKNTYELADEIVAAVVEGSRS